MKKTIIVISVFLASCGGSTTKVEATYNDTPGPDSSMILPALIDTLKTSDTLVVKEPLTEQ